MVQRVSARLPLAAGVHSSGSVQGPDGGVTTNYFFPRNTSYFAGLKWKTVSPQGAVIESYWERNSPYIDPDTSTTLDKQNAFVKAEYRKPAGGSQYSAIATTMDKNGSVLSTMEYAFGVTVPRDTASTRPNAVPSTGSILRKTVHAYHSESDADGATPTQEQTNAYWCNGSRFIAPIKPVFATLVAGFYRAVLPLLHPLKVVLAVKGSLRRARARP